MIIRIRDRFFVWSINANRPISPGLTRHELAMWYRHRFGAAQARTVDLKGLLDRAEIDGLSSMMGEKTVADLIAPSGLTPDQVYDRWVTGYRQAVTFDLAEMRALRIVIDAHANDLPNERDRKVLAGLKLKLATVAP